MDTMTTDATPAHAPVALSANDSLWLNMDSPENLMIIESVIWFDAPLDLDRVRRNLTQRLVGRFPVFSWRPERPDGPGADHWVPDENFDIDRHLTHVEMEAGDPHEQVSQFLSQLMSTPLPMDRPLWHAYVLTGPGLSVLVQRYHHAIADGTALVRVLLESTTATPDGDLDDDLEQIIAADRDSTTTLPARGTTSPVEPVPGSREHSSLGELAANAATKVLTLPLAAGSAVTKPAAGLAHRIDDAITRSPHGGLVGKVADQALGTAGIVDKLVVGTAPDALPFGHPGIVKHADWATPIDLPLIKKFANAHGATVNDVMLALVSGALRRYILARGEEPVDVVTMIPVNLRPLDAPLPVHLGNKFALITLELPLSEPTGAGRLAAAKARMDVVKHGPEASVTFGLAHMIGGLGAVNAAISRGLTAFFSDKAFGVTTNVAGPTEPRYYAGRLITGMLGWVPGASSQTLGACIFSYNGRVTVGFKADAHVLPDVGNLVAFFEAEVADLLDPSRTPLESGLE